MKQWRIFTQRQAKEDTDEIWHYIAQDNPTAAEAFLDAIEETSERLSVFPAIGGLRYFYHAELHGLRILPLPKFEKYILFYHFKEDDHVVEIVRIVHGARVFHLYFDSHDNCLVHVNYRQTGPPACAPIPHLKRRAVLRSRLPPGS